MKTQAELTAREYEVLQLIAHGKTNKEISTALHITVRSVERHITNLFQKLTVSNRTEAALLFWKGEQRVAD